VDRRPPAPDCLRSSDAKVSIVAAGTRELVVDSNGQEVAIIENTEVEIKRMVDVDLAFAIAEGEGFQTVDEWRDAHTRFFTSPDTVALLGDPPVTIDDDTLVVCFRFRVVEVV